jgi:hypothetical protein
VRYGPAAVAGAARVTVVLPETLGSVAEVAVMVTVAGAGYGVWYMPVVEMVPASPVQLAGGVTVQTQLGEVPLLIDAVNCWAPPIVTVGEFGVTVTVTGLDVEVGVGEACPPPPPPQPTMTAHTNAPTNRRIPRIPPPPQNNT